MIWVGVCCFIQGGSRAGRRMFAQRLNLSAAWSLVRVWRKQRDKPEVRPEADACLGLGKTPRTTFATEVEMGKKGWGVKAPDQ